MPEPITFLEYFNRYCDSKDKPHIGTLIIKDNESKNGLYYSMDDIVNAFLCQCCDYDPVALVQDFLNSEDSECPCAVYLNDPEHYACISGVKHLMLCLNNDSRAIWSAWDIIDRLLNGNV